MLTSTLTPLFTMGFVKRFIRLLEKVDRFLEKGLHLFTAKKTSKSQGTDASKLDETPSLGVSISSNDTVDVIADDFETEDCNNGNGDLDDASSNADSEDSWYMETPPLNLNYDALKHVATHFLPGSHGACIEISTLPRGVFH